LIAPSHRLTLTLMERAALQEELKSVYDLERLAGRIAFGNVNARDLIQLKKSLQKIPTIQAILKKIDCQPLQSLASQLQYPQHLEALLEKSIQEDPPISITEGSIIKDGYNKQLDT